MWPRSGIYWRSFEVGIVPRHVRRLLVPQPAPRALGHDDLKGAAEPKHAAEDNNLPLQGGGRAPQLANASKAGGWGSNDAPHAEESHATPTPTLPLAGGGNSQNLSGANPPQTKAAKSKRAAPPKKLNEHKLNELDALRYALLRRLETMLGSWRECPSRFCRRERACVSSGHECAKLPQPPRDPAAEVAALASFAAGLKRRAAELAAGGGTNDGGRSNEEG